MERTLPRCSSAFSLYSLSSFCINCEPVHGKRLFYLIPSYFNKIYSIISLFPYIQSSPRNHIHPTRLHRNDAPPAMAVMPVKAMTGP